MLADGVAWFHTLYVLLMIASLPVVILFPPLRILAGLFSSITLIVWHVTGGCPLKAWEQGLRREHDQLRVYEESFVTHYANKLFRTNWTDEQTHLVIYPYMFAIILFAILL